MTKLILVIVLVLAGCECEAEVRDYLPDGGLSGAYCAQECVTSQDCPEHQHCSWHPRDPKGICFKD